MPDDDKHVQQEIIVVEEEQQPKPLKNHTGEKIPQALKTLVHTLRDQGQSYRVIHQQTHLAVNTIRAILRLDTPDPVQVDKVKKGLAAKFYVKTDQALDNISDEKLSDMSAYQLMGIASLGAEKARLIDGESTQNVDISTLTCDLVELDKRLAEKQAHLRGIEREERVNKG